MADIAAGRICSCCKQQKLAAEFYVRSDTGRLTSHCRKCRTVSIARWQATPNGVACRLRHSTSPECKEYHKNYSREWHKAHLEHRREQNRLWRRADRKTDKARLYDREYRKTPKGRATKYAQIHKRRARKLLTTVGDCLDKIKLLGLERFCRWCCCRLTSENRTIDHIIPLARNGSHSPDNLAAACRQCNCSRGAKLIEDWLPTLQGAY